VQDEWDRKVKEAQTCPIVAEVQRIYEEKLARNEPCNPFQLAAELYAEQARTVTAEEDPYVRAMAFVFFPFVFSKHIIINLNREKLA
jgi:hypothetical protein